MTILLGLVPVFNLLDTVQPEAAKEGDRGVKGRQQARRWAKSILER